MTRGLWPLLLGFGVWGLAFNTLYAVHALGCYWQWPGEIQRTVLVALYLATLGVLAGLLWLQRQTASGIFKQAGLILIVCALLVSAVIFAPTTFLSTCL